MEIHETQKIYRKWVNMTRYDRAIKELELNGITEMKVFGNSMMPIIKSGSRLTFEKLDSYTVGDIVFCKVRGNYIDAHKITKISENRGYMISNNKGHDNGWTKTIYGKVTHALYNKEEKIFK